MAGEIPLIRMEQGATEMTVPSSCFISVESGGLIEIESGGQVDVAGHVDVESGGYVSLESGGYITAASGSYLTVGTVSTEVAAATLRKFGPVYLDGSSSGAYTLPDHVSVYGRNDHGKRDLHSVHSSAIYSTR